MKETERLIFNSLCKEYVKTMMVRSETAFIFPQSVECAEELWRKLDIRLKNIEDKMLHYLKEVSVDGG